MGFPFNVRGLISQIFVGVFSIFFCDFVLLFFTSFFGFRALARNFLFFFFGGGMSKTGKSRSARLGIAPLAQFRGPIVRFGANSLPGPLCHWGREVLPSSGSWVCYIAINRFGAAIDRGVKLL